MEGVEHAASLAAAADHRRAGALRPPRRVGGDRHKPEGLERRALALDRQRRDRRGVHRMTDQAERVVPEQDVSGSRRLLEPRGDIDDVTRRERAARRGRARDGLPRVDPDAHREIDTALAPQLTAQVSDLLAHLRCRPHRPQRVVLMHDGIPKTPMTASPMKFSTVPPWRSIASPIRPNQRCIAQRSVSGSTRSPSAVEPTTSANTTVTTFRRSPAAGAADTGAPHAGQNRDRPGSPSPQRGQVSTTQV